MLKIIKSLVVIVAVAAVAAGATGAYFSSAATITNNTFSTGTLEIRVNGQPSVIGANFSPVEPGDVYTSPRYDINNYGQPWFDGPSNLDADYLRASITNLTYDSDPLRKAVVITLEVSRDSGATWHEAYNDRIYMYTFHGAQDLLSPVGMPSLIPGSSLSFRYKVSLPDTGDDQSGLMGKTLHWDLVVEGRTS